MAPNPESNNGRDESTLDVVDTSEPGAETDATDAAAPRGPSAPSREMARSGPSGRMRPLPGTGIQDLLASMQFSSSHMALRISQDVNRTAGIAFRLGMEQSDGAVASAAIRDAARVAVPEACANSPVTAAVNSQIKQLADGLSALPATGSLSQSLASTQIAAQRAAALDPALQALENQRRLSMEPALQALENQRRLMVPTSLTGGASGPLGLAVSTELARTTQGLNESLFRSTLGAAADLSRRLAEIADPLRITRAAWDLSTEVRSDIEAARAAAVRGDPDGVIEVFADRWLNLPKGRRKERMRALADALIWLNMEDLDVDNAWGTLRELEKATRRNMRRGSLIGETQLLGGPVHYLEDLASAWGEDTAIGKCPQGRSPEVTVLGGLDALGGLDDVDAQSLGMVLGRLDPFERRILLAKGQPDGNRKRGLSWAKAAQEVGATPKDGKRVAAKAIRLGKQVADELEDIVRRDGGIR